MDKTLGMTIAVAIVCTIAYLFHHDLWLYMFSAIVFRVAGVAWELNHWQKHQEFSDDEEIWEG